MLFENNDTYYDLINVYHNLNVKESNDNFFKGNMFDKEYSPYKDYSIKEYVPKNDQEQKLIDIMRYSFAVNDFAIYLDVHPDDNNILKKYQNASRKLNELEQTYEKTYGPLSIDTAFYDTYKWILSPWPWDKEDGKYV